MNTAPAPIEHRRTTNLYVIQVHIPGLSYRGVTELMGRLGNAVIAHGYRIDGSWASASEQTGSTSVRLPSDDTAVRALAQSILHAELKAYPHVHVTVHTGLGVHRREVRLEGTDG